MNYKKPPFPKDQDPNRQMTWYDLKELLFQAIKKQFRYVSPLIKNQLKKLSPPQLESVLDILPQFSELQYLETHLAELSQKPEPDTDKDRFRQRPPSPERQINREFRPAPAFQRPEPSVEIARNPDTPGLKIEPGQERIIDTPSVLRADIEPEVSVSPVTVPVQPPVQPPPVSHPMVTRQPLPAPPPVMPPSPITAPPVSATYAGVVRTTIPVLVGETQIDLVFEYDRFADRENHRGVRFLLSLDETQLLVARYLTQRERIQPIEPRVAEAIQSFFGDAAQILNRAVQNLPSVSPEPVIPETAAPEPEPSVSPEPDQPGIEAAAHPAPVQLSLPVEPVTETDEPDFEWSTPVSNAPRNPAPKRHRRTNQELAAAGISVEKRTRLTSEKIDLASLKFDPRLVSILEIDQARQLNICPVSFLENSTDLLVLFVEPEGKVRVYTYFNRAANRAALAALVGITPKNREQVKIRTFRVSQDFLDEFLNQAATMTGSE